MDRGRRLGVDVGMVRVGVAISDPDGILATPLVTLQRDTAGWAAWTQAQASLGRKDALQASGPQEGVLPSQAAGEKPGVPRDVTELARLVVEHEVVEVVVGLPVTLAGTESYAAVHARTYAQVVAEAVAPVPVALTDERMSTAVATRRLSERGVRGGRRRAVVDQAAAVEILQGWLDALRRRRNG
jgi:putative Holliday junction resolvase